MIGFRDQCKGADGLVLCIATPDTRKDCSTVSSAKYTILSKEWVLVVSDEPSRSATGNTLLNGASGNCVGSLRVPESSESAVAQGNRA
jgi:hypothetical protein